MKLRGAILLFLLLVYYMAGYDLVTGPGLALHSSRRYDPFGSSAFRELLESRGVETDLLERPTPPDTRDTTLIIPVALVFFYFAAHMPLNAVARYSIPLLPSMIVVVSTYMARKGPATSP